MILLSPLFLLALLPALVSAATPTSFCKCTCFTNSTIIALDAPAKPSSVPAHNILLPRSDSLLPRDSPLGLDDGVYGLESLGIRADSSKGPAEGDDRKQYRAGNCNDCNRQFCLGYNLPICKGASEGDVFTTCFQRDSRKDEAVVFIFIFATAGLLGWSFIRPWVEKWVAKARERRSYLPVSTATEGS